jgi:putative restriction endonuclease
MHTWPDLDGSGRIAASAGRVAAGPVGQVRVPHKPLLLLWLFGQFAATGSSQASYEQAE